MLNVATETTKNQPPHRLKTHSIRARIPGLPGKLLGLALVATTVSMVCMAPRIPAVHAQSERYEDARGLVGRVQDDLKRAEEMASQRKHSKENERIDNAERHLSAFDKALAKGKFDSGKLDAAISDTQNVVDHNTLSPQDRDTLLADLRNLRYMRTSRGR